MIKLCVFEFTKKKNGENRGLCSVSTTTWCTGSWNRNFAHTYLLGAFDAYLDFKTTTFLYVLL